jgi:hypothetical protein
MDSGILMLQDSILVCSPDPRIPHTAGELDTTEKGFLRFKSDCWKAMDEKEKEFVREYNASIKHGEPLDKLTLPDASKW